MSKAGAASDAADLDRFFNHLGTFIRETDFPVLRRHRAHVVERCLAVVDGPNRDVALGTTVALLAVEQKPDLDILKAGLLSDDGRRSVLASNFVAAVSKGQNPDLLRMCDEVARVGHAPFAVIKAVQGAITLRGASAEADLALTRLYENGHRQALGGVLSILIDKAPRDLRTAGMRLFERCIDGTPRGQFDVRFFADRAVHALAHASEPHGCSP